MNIRNILEYKKYKKYIKNNRSLENKTSSKNIQHNLYEYSKKKIENYFHYIHYNKNITRLFSVIHSDSQIINIIKFINEKANAFYTSKLNEN